MTVSLDGTARIWDAKTGQSIGPPLVHPGVDFVAFSPDGRTILTHSFGQFKGVETRLWDVDDDLPDDLPRVVAWVEMLTGMTMDDHGVVHLLDHAGWLECRQQLERLGGAPRAPADQWADPIIFGPDPPARARNLLEVGRWRDADDEFARVIRAWPLTFSFWDERGRIYIDHEQPETAAAIYVEAVTHLPDTLELRHHLALSLLLNHDVIGYSRACADVVKRFGFPSDPDEAHQIARQCVLAPWRVADGGVPVRLAEIAVDGFARSEIEYDSEWIAAAHDALGAALYRAGRFEEAIGRLEKGIKERNGRQEPAGWPFLAMAHYRLGHHDEARRYLNRISNHQPSREPDAFWDELEIRLLRSEAEAVILCDPVFPDDPFAH